MSLHMRHPSIMHPVNRAMVDDASWGDRAADRLAAFIGSWRFVAIQTVIVVIWVVGNVIMLFHFDPYPFILLNLAFSTQAAYAAPLILIASNRSAQRDRLTLEHASGQTDREERQNEELIAGNQHILERVERIEVSIDAIARSITVRDGTHRPPDGPADPTT